MTTINKKFNNSIQGRLTHRVVFAVSMYQEFGCRGGYGKIVNTVTPDEGIYLARLARQYYKKTGDKDLAYEFAESCFSKDIYNRMKFRNEDKPKKWYKVNGKYMQGK